ncbi:hypothetical protein [Parabacteroides johnsonii]
MRRKIELADMAARAEICRALGISKPLLSLALSFKRNSVAAQQARAMALEHGGILMEEKPMSRTVRILNAKGETERTIEE